MTHDELRERLHAYRDGELAPTEREAVASHLKECGDCRLALKAWERVAQSLLRAPAALSSEAFVTRVMTRIDEEERVEAPIWGSWALAPAFALAAGLFVLFWPGPSVSAPSAELLLLADGPDWAFVQQETQADDVLIDALGAQP